MRYAGAVCDALLLALGVAGLINAVRFVWGLL
jgi:hypothetical protein